MPRRGPLANRGVHLHCRIRGAYWLLTVSMSYQVPCVRTGRQCIIARAGATRAQLYGSDLGFVLTRVLLCLVLKRE